MSGMPKSLSQWNDEMYLAHPTPYENKIAGIIEHQRLAIIEDMAAITPRDKVIELGCERGMLMASLPKCKELVGVDISGAALKDAKKLLGRRAKFVKADIEKNIKLPAKSFDVIICSQVLEHVKHPEKVMKNIYRLAKDDARIVVSVPNEKFLLRTKQFFLKLGLLDFLFPNIEPTVSAWHLQVFTDTMLRGIAKKDFRVIKHRRAFNVYLVYQLEKRS